MCMVLLCFVLLAWWCYQMETFSALLALCAGNSPVTGEFPTRRPVTQSFDFFFDLCLNKRFSTQSWGWWYETPSCSLWHCNVDALAVLSGFMWCIYPYPSGILHWHWDSHINGLVQDCGNSNALALELLQSCIQPLIWLLLPCWWCDPKGYGYYPFVSQHNKSTKHEPCAWFGRSAIFLLISERWCVFH